MKWFWFFTVYSFAGFLLEILFARVSGGRPDRKCMLLLPLCPVYGLGACGILLLPPRAAAEPPLLFLLGGLTATAAEYLLAVFYEKVLTVTFWNYRGLPGNVQGRICLPFSLAWGALTLPLVLWLHPLLAPRLEAIPLPVSLTAVCTVLADALVSGVMLRRTGDRSCLRWYAG